MNVNKCIYKEVEAPLQDVEQLSSKRTHEIIEAKPQKVQKEFLCVIDTDLVLRLSTT